MLSKSLLATAMAVILLLGGCGDSDEDPAASPTTGEASDSTEPSGDATSATETTGDREAPLYTEPTEPDSTATTGPSGPAAGGEIVSVAESDLGQILVDSDGLTLYGFTNDVGGTSSCYDTCAATWPPLTVEGDELPAGLDSGVFSLTEREDGTNQVVAGDWPLYLYAADTAAGEANGQGFGGIWYVVAPDGTLIQ